MILFSNRKALGAARREAALARVRAQELEEVLADLLEGVDALPMSVAIPDHPDLRAAVAHRRGVSAKYPALQNPLFRDRVERARRTLGVR